jgi:hypothetical protein
MENSSSLMGEEAITTDYPVLSSITEDRHKTTAFADRHILLVVTLSIKSVNYIRINVSFRFQFNDSIYPVEEQGGASSQLRVGDKFVSKISFQLLVIPYNLFQP